MCGGAVLSSGLWYGLNCGTALVQIIVVIACMSSVGVRLPSPVLKRLCVITSAQVPRPDSGSGS
eukprot:8509199-Prorocentrum_lima.AAC.1